MRRRTGTALLVLATCVGLQSALAQVKAGQTRTSFGIVGGLNDATLTGDDNELGSGIAPSSRTGFYGGVAANVPLGTSLFFQPQALFSMQGAKYEELGENVTIKLDYLHVPLFLGLRIPMQGAGINPYVMAGPYVGVKTGCKYSSTAGTGLGSGSCDDLTGTNEKIKGFDYGLALGAGVEVPLGSGVLQLGARFSMGLSELVKDVKVKNSIVSIGAGYFFGR
jgi:hypothetical protein